VYVKVQSQRVCCSQTKRDSSYETKGCQSDLIKKLYIYTDVQADLVDNRTLSLLLEECESLLSVRVLGMSVEVVVSKAALGQVPLIYVT